VPTRPRDYDGGARLAGLLTVLPFRDGGAEADVSGPSGARRAPVGFGLTEPGAGSDAGNCRRRPFSTATHGSSTGRRRSLRTPAPTSRWNDDHGRYRNAAGRKARNLQHHRSAGYAGLLSRQEVPEDGLASLGHARARLRGRESSEGKPARPRGAGYKQFLRTLDGGRISVAALSVGLAMERTTKRSLMQRTVMRSASRSARFRQSNSNSWTCSARSNTPS